MVTGKMLQVVTKKLELMNPADLTQGTVKEWVEMAIRTDREACYPPAADSLGVCCANSRHGSKGNIEPKQGEINFTPEFDGL
jgi:hypothetical protein